MKTQGGGANKNKIIELCKLLDGHLFTFENGFHLKEYNSSVAMIATEHVLDGRDLSNKNIQKLTEAGYYYVGYGLWTNLKDEKKN